MTVAWASAETEDAITATKPRMLTINLGDNFILTSSE
jgi:hypothetical protein